jgi:type I restriction enzyme M protein
LNKEKKVSNGNYLWISFFHSYLGPKGRAGFVMSSQASSAGHAEGEVRRKLVETGDVDVMISIRSNFFYTRTVPCELWHFDKGKPDDRRDKVLMIDARNIYTKVTRKIYDFTPEQLSNIAAIVWLYRGQTERFVGLVQSYLDRTITEAAKIAEQVDLFRKAYDRLAEATVPFLATVPAESALLVGRAERDEAVRSCFDSLDEWTSRISQQWPAPCAPELPAQRTRQTELEALASACRDLVKDADLACKLSARLVDAVDKEPASRESDNWDSRAIGRLEKELESRRRELVEQLRRTVYFERQALWLLVRFPDGTFTAVPGLCRIVTQAEIEAADWSLTPGRHVGVAQAEADEDFDFEQALRDIHVELADLNREARALAGKIQANFEALGI